MSMKSSFLRHSWNVWPARKADNLPRYWKSFALISLNPPWSWNEKHSLNTPLCSLTIYKTTQIVSALWLAEKRVCMRVCKHGYDVKMFCFSRANHASTNLKKVLSWKIRRQVYFIYPFPRRLKLGKSLETCCVNFFFAWADIEREKTHILESIFFAKQGLITRTSFVYKTSRLVRISLLISALNKRIFFFSGESYFIKAIENFFPVNLHILI